MADIAAVLRKTIDTLPSNTPQNRQKVYDKARSSIRGKLEAKGVQGETLQKQMGIVERAISAVESQYGFSDDLDRLFEEDGAENAPASQTVGRSREPEPEPIEPVPVPETRAAPREERAPPPPPQQPAQARATPKPPSEPAMDRPVDRPVPPPVPLVPPAHEPEEERFDPIAAESFYHEAPEPMPQPDGDPDDGDGDAARYDEPTSPLDRVEPDVEGEARIGDDIASSDLPPDPRFDPLVAPEEERAAFRDDPFDPDRGQTDHDHRDDHGDRVEHDQPYSGRLPAASERDWMIEAAGEDDDAPDFDQRVFDERGHDRDRHEDERDDEAFFAGAAGAPLTPRRNDRFDEARHDDGDEADLVSTDHSRPIHDRHHDHDHDDDDDDDASAGDGRRRGRKGPILALLAVLLIAVLAGIGYAGMQNGGTVMASIQQVQNSITSLFAGGESLDQQPLDGGMAEAPSDEPASPDQPQDVATAPADGGTGGAAPADDTPEKFTQRLAPDGSESDPGLADAPGGNDDPEGSSVAQLSTPANPSSGAPQAGENGQQQPVQVGQRAIYSEERTSAEGLRRIQGNVVWSEIQKAPGPNLDPEPAIRGEAFFPELGSSVLLTLQRNGDRSLPASHIMELTFDPPEETGRSIREVIRLMLKPTEAATGQPLDAFPVQIADNFFLLTLAEGSGQRDSNVSLLRTNDWLDLLVTLDSGRRALFTMEKGIPGDAVFSEVFQQWSNNPLPES